MTNSQSEIAKKRKMKTIISKPIAIVAKSAGKFQKTKKAELPLTTVQYPQEPHPRFKRCNAMPISKIPKNR